MLLDVKISKCVWILVLLTTSSVLKRNSGVKLRGHLKMNLQKEPYLRCTVCFCCSVFFFSFFFVFMILSLTQIYVSVPCTQKCLVPPLFCPLWLWSWPVDGFYRSFIYLIKWLNVSHVVHLIHIRAGLNDAEFKSVGGCLVQSAFNQL